MKTPLVLIFISITISCFGQNQLIKNLTVTGSATLSGSTTISGSPIIGGVTFSSNAATSLNSITAVSGSDLVLNGGSSNGNVVIAAGASGSVLIESNVGIGTGSVAPATEWEVVSSATSTERGIMSAQFNSGANGAQFLGRKARGTELVPSTVVTGDTMAALIAEGFDGVSFLQTGSVEIVSTGTIAATRVPTRINFYTGTDALPSVKTLAMYIDETQALVGNTGGLTLKAGANFAAINFDTQSGAAVVKDNPSASGNVYLQVGANTSANLVGQVFSSSGCTSGLELSSLATDSPVTIHGNRFGGVVVKYNGASVFTVVNGTSGGLQFNQYTSAGTLSVNSSGMISSSSDARLKNIKGAFTRGLADVIRLSPALYSWKEEELHGVHTIYPGFIAQDVQKSIPEAVGIGRDGILSLQDRGIMAALVNADKELDARTKAPADWWARGLAVTALLLALRGNLKRRNSL